MSVSKEALDYLISLNYSDVEVINDLKGTFHNEISSIRTRCRIRTLQDLIKVLGKRLALTAHSLDTIALKLPSHIYQEYTTKLQMITSPRSPGPSRPAMQVQYNPVQPPALQPFQPCNHQYHVYPSATSRNVNLDKVYKIMCDELGPKHWKNFARELGIREANIDAYDGGDTTESIRRVLREHETNSTELHWRQNLLLALDQAKRTDLRRKVELKLDEFKLTYHSL